MRLKKLMSVSLCMTMVLSLAGCTFNPKDAISNIINGKDGGSGNANVVASAEKVNKNAVFKEAKTIALEGFDYIDGIKTANGKFYIAQVIYDYPEIDGPVLYEGDLKEPVDEEIIAEETNEDEIPEDVTEENDVEDGDFDEADFDEEDFVDFEDNYDDYEDYYDEINTKLHIASFTNENDIQYYDIDLNGGNEYFSGSNWAFDAEENFYTAISTYDQTTYQETYTLRKYSLDGTILKEVDIDGSNEEYFYIRYLFVDNNSNVYITSEQSVTVYDKDLNKKYYYKSDIKGAYLTNASLNDKGELIFSIMSWETDTPVSKTFKMDTQGNVTEDSSLNDLIAQKDLIQGKGYDFYYTTSSSVMGVNIGDKAATEVVNFYDSDINPGEFYGSLYFASAEQFLTTKEDENGSSVVIYEKVPAEDVKDKEIITLGTVYGSYSLASQIIKFNKNNDTYKAFSAFSTDKDGDKAEFTWIRFLYFNPKDDEDFLKADAYIEAKGDLQLGVFKDEISMDCRISEVKPWVLEKK